MNLNLYIYYTICNNIFIVEYTEIQKLCKKHAIVQYFFFLYSHLLNIKCHKNVQKSGKYANVYKTEAYRIVKKFEFHINISIMNSIWIIILFKYR